MIARLTGRVIDRAARSLVLDVQGVGYRVATLSSLRQRPKTQAELTLYIHHHVTADSEELYGFASAEDLQYFELLLTVPSVGPRTAMNILDIAPPRILSQAVSEEDATLLTKVAGVGKKTAQRLIVELKGKLATVPLGVPGTVQHETITALTTMGYSLAQARTAVSELPADVGSVEEAVRAVLRASAVTRP